MQSTLNQLLNGKSIERSNPLRADAASMIREFARFLFDILETSGSQRLQVTSGFYPLPIECVERN